MNKYDEKYEIRLAKESDIGTIMDFIDKNWKKGHILATNRSFFEYEFLDENGNVHFLLAINKATGNLESIFGFLMASHDPEHLDIWGCLLRTLDGNMGLLGIELIKRCPEIIRCRHNLGVGANPTTTIPLFKVLLHRYTAKMKHYYMISELEEFKIARIDERPARIESNPVQYKVIRFSNIEELNDKFDLKQLIDQVPYKDSWYLDHRFFNHPIYKYEIYGILVEGRVEAVFVLREQKYEDRCAIRFVDYIGEQSALRGTSDFFKDQLKRQGCEYIDFYCNGFHDEYIQEAGFTLRSEDDRNIIPNYFSPFVQENIDIWVHSTDNHSLFTKADDDQDRPSA